MSLAAFAFAFVIGADPTIEDAVQKSFRSATFTAVVQSAEQTELQKINKDFAQSYRFKTMDVWMKEPFKIRMETKVDDSSILMIINGTTRKLSIPKARLSQRFDLAKSPGKRQTALDFGILPADLFDSLFVAAYVRTERRTGEYVFDITYDPLLKDHARHRIWVDPTRRFMTKRQWYANIGGHLMATFEYSEPINQGGVWFPTVMTVFNADNKLAGTTLYKNININASLEEKIFAVG